MIPPRGLFQLFESNYYETTYLPPVDLSDAALAPYLLSNEDPELAEKVQELISYPEVQPILLQPLSYDLDVQVPAYVITLQGRQFKTLSTKGSAQNSDYKAR